MSIVKDRELKETKEFIYEWFNRFDKEDLEKIENLYQSLNVDNAKEIRKEVEILRNKEFKKDKECGRLRDVEFGRTAFLQF